MPVVNIPDFESVEVAPPRLDIGKGYVGNIVELPVIKHQDENDSSSKQYIEVKVKILEGPPQSEMDPVTGSPSPTGRSMTDRLYLVPGAFFKVKQLLVSAGLIARNDKDSPMAKGQIALDALIGAKFPFNIVASMKDGTEYRNIQYVI